MTEPIKNLIAAAQKANRLISDMAVQGRYRYGPEWHEMAEDLCSALAAAEHAAKPASLLDLHGLGRDVAPHIEPPKRVQLPESFRELIQSVQRHGSVYELCAAVQELANAIESIEVRP